MKWTVYHAKLPVFGEGVWLSLESFFSEWYAEMAANIDMDFAEVWEIGK